MAQSRSKGLTALGQWLVDAWRLKGDMPEYRPLPHKLTIQRARTRAYWDVLNADTGFRREMGVLFANWSWNDANRFVRKWRLPRFALKDLAWSRDLWLLRGRPAPALEVGYRSYPGLEHDATTAERRQLGYIAAPAHDFDPNTYRRRARLTHAAAVEIRTFKDIAMRDTGVAGGWSDTKFVRRCIAEFAHPLGIPLPARRRGPRRKNPPE